MTTTEARIRKALGNMRYMGSLSFSLPDGDLSMETLADLLEAIQRRLDGVARKDEERTSELQDLRRDLAGFGRLLNSAQTLAKGAGQ